MLKGENQLPNCLKRAKTSVVLIVFNYVIYHVRVYTVTISLHESSTKKTIFWLVTTCIYIRKPVKKMYESST